MFNTARIVIVLILVTQHIRQIYGKTLPTKINENGGEVKNATTFYYRRNVFGPNTYAFGFEVNDKVSGNIQFRDERRYDNGTIQGIYGYLRPDGSIMVTHFLADSDQGYLSESRNFEPGEEPKWQANWPTKKANFLLEKTLDSVQPEVVDNDAEKLNLTSILLPVEAINEELGIDLNPPELEKVLVNPAVLEVINGEAPLISDPKSKDNSIGFATINKFIPPEFPIVPFELPQEDVKINLNEGLGAKPIPVLKRTNDSDTPSVKKPVIDSLPYEKFNESQETNAEKSIPTIDTKPSEHNDGNLSNSTVVKYPSIDGNSDWYNKVIKKTRQNYLEIV